MVKFEYSSVLLVGGGAMAIRQHLPRLLGLLGSRSVDIYEADPARRALLAAQFRRERRVRLLEHIDSKDQFDLVVIATPPRFHYDYYRQLEGQAERFLIEKPMTVNAGQAAQLADYARSKGKKVFVNLLRRGLGSYRLLRTLYQQQEFGRLERVQLCEGGVFSWEAASLGPFSKDLSGGGVLMDIGPHALDLLLQLFDELTLQAAFMDSAGTAVEANCTLDLAADGGVPVTVSLSRNRCLSNTTLLQFERATCSAGVRDNAIAVKAHGTTEYVMYPAAGPGSAAAPGFAALLDAFYEQFLMQGQNRGVGPAESQRIMQIIDQAYATGQPMQRVF